MNSDFFIKYLKNNDFPNKNYNAITSHPDKNYFTQKYKKKFLYSQESNISNSESKKLFNESFKYVSTFQQNLFQKNIENYISGGFAQKLYSTLYDVKNDDKILTTKDCDIYVYYDNIKINNNVIL